jgi:hypothetical protein
MPFLKHAWHLLPEETLKTIEIIDSLNQTGLTIQHYPPGTTTKSQQKGFKANSLSQATMCRTTSKV